MLQKAVPEPFLKKWNWAYIWTDNLKCYKFVFILCPCPSLPIYIKTKVQKLHAFMLITCFDFIKIFLKNKVWNYSHCLIFCKIFEEKYLLCYILLYEQISLPDCIYFMRYWRICAI